MFISKVNIEGIWKELKITQNNYLVTKTGYFRFHLACRFFHIISSLTESMVSLCLLTFAVLFT